MSRAWNVEMAALRQMGSLACSPRIGSFRSFEDCSQGSCTISSSTSVLQTIFLICVYFRLNLYQAKTATKQNTCGTVRMYEYNDNKASFSMNVTAYENEREYCAGTM
jgi:hypothetical protein